MNDENHLLLFSIKSHFKNVKGDIFVGKTEGNDSKKSNVKMDELSILTKNLLLIVSQLKRNESFYNCTFAEERQKKISLALFSACFPN